MMTVMFVFGTNPTVFRQATKEANTSRALVKEAAKTIMLSAKSKCITRKRASPGSTLAWREPLYKNARSLKYGTQQSWTEDTTLSHPRVDAQSTAGLPNVANRTLLPMVEALWTATHVAQRDMNLDVPATEGRRGGYHARQPSATGRAPTASHGPARLPNRASPCDKPRRASGGRTSTPKGQAKHDAGWSSSGSGSAVASAIPRLHSCAERRRPGRDNWSAAATRRALLRRCQALAAFTAAPAHAHAARAARAGHQRQRRSGAPPQVFARGGCHEVASGCVGTSRGTPEPTHPSREGACVGKTGAGPSTLPFRA